MNTSRLPNIIFNFVAVFAMAFLLKPYANGKQPVGKFGMLLIVLAVYTLGRVVLK